MTLDPYRAALAIQRQRSAVRRDPLAHFKPASTGQELLIRWCGKTEVLLRGGNKSGKTLGGAALGVALAQGRTELAGIPLPRMPKPNIGAVLSLDYKQQKGSVQSAYLQMLGEWPHRIGYLQRGQNIIGSIRVKPEGWHSDDPETWSEIVFISQENTNALVGYRLHWCHADEPPVERVWREARKAGFAQHQFPTGGRYVKFITMTPLFASQWMWVRADFDGEPPGRREVVCSVYDNRALTRAEIAQLEQDYENDPLKAARLHGDYVDTSGASPFGKKGFEVLQEWKRECAVPTLRQFRVQSERDGGMSVINQTVDVEVWAEPDRASAGHPGESYYVIADPSTGVDDKQHDPAGIHVWARRSKRLVARYHGYLDAHGLGNLATALARQYGNALIDVDTTGGYGSPFIAAVRKSGYQHLSRDIRPDRPDKWEEAYGFKITVQTRAEIIAGIQSALDDAAAGNRSCWIWSEGVVSCLLNVTVDGKGKVLAVDGRHDEDMILMGRALHLMMVRPVPPAPRAAVVKVFDKILQKTRQSMEAHSPFRRARDRW